MRNSTLTPPPIGRSISYFGPKSLAGTSGPIGNPCSCKPLMIERASPIVWTFKRLARMRVRIYVPTLAISAGSTRRRDLGLS